MSKLTPVKRETLILIWNTDTRRVPVEVMLTSAQMESGIGEGLYDLTAERYEKVSHERALANPEKWGAYGLAAEDWTSWGPFQMMGFVLREVGYYGIWEQQRLLVENEELPAEDYLRLCMRAYDKHMARLIRKRGLPGAFKAYNGAGLAAERYQSRARLVWERLRRELKTRDENV